MFASLRSCSILRILSFSFLCASSACHADEFHGEQDWLVRTRHHWPTRKIPSAKGRTVAQNIKFWRLLLTCMSKVSKQFPAIIDELYKHWWLQLIKCVNKNVSSCRFIKQMIVYTFTCRCFCNKGSTQTNINNLCWKAPTIFTAFSVPHVCLSSRLFYF